MGGDTSAAKARQLLERLWNEPMARSRNANFVRFRDDLTYRHAVQHVRSLLAFRGDLTKYRGRSEVDVRPLASGRGAQITMRVRDLRFKRFFFVSTHELELLRRDPAWHDAKVVVVDDS